MLVLAAALAGCRQDMHDQPKYEPLEASAFFADGRASRPLVPDTVARGHLDDDDHYFRGKIGAADADTFPVPVDRALVERGRERFDIFCAPCHDRLGNGQGMIVKRGYRPPPSFHIDRLRESPAGHFFDVVTNGFGAMPDYAAQIPVPDRWAIIAYVRALQLSQHVPIAALSADDVRRVREAAQAAAAEKAKEHD